MNEADQQRVEAIERLFASTDMQVLLADVSGWMEAIASQWRTLKPEQLPYEQGRYDGMEQIYKLGELYESLKQRAIEAETESLEVAAYA